MSKAILIALALASTMVQAGSFEGLSPVSRSVAARQAGSTGFSADANPDHTNATPVSYTHLDVYKRQVLQLVH